MKIKNMKLMLLGLLAMGSVNAMAAVEYTTHEGLVYAYNSEDLDENEGDCTFYGVNASADAAVKESVVIPESFTFYDQVSQKTLTLYVAGVTTGWATKADHGCASVAATCKNLTINTNLGDVINPSDYAGLTALENLTIAYTNTAKDVTVGKASATFPTSLKVVTLTNLKGKRKVVIAQDAFKNCTALTTVKLPAGKVEIGQDAFSGASALATIDLKGVTTIGANAFKGAAKLTAIDLTVATSIGANAFENAGLEALVIPANVETIGADAFKGNTELASVEINNNTLTEVPAVFGSDTKIASIKVTSTSITSIAANAFKDIAVATKVTLDLSGATELATVNASAFAAAAFTSVKLNGTKLTGLTNIPLTGATASLAEITLPAGITALTTELAGMKKLTSLTLPNPAMTWATGTLEGDVLLETITGFDALTAYPAAMTASMFKNCKKLGSIKLPATVTTIGASAFESCEALTTVTIPDASQITAIGNSAFKGCKKLTAIDLKAAPLVVTTGLGTSTFEGCEALTSIDLSAALLTGLDATNQTTLFKGCKKLATVTVNAEKLTLIGDNIFEGTAIKDFNFPSVTALGKVFGTIAADKPNTTLETVTLGSVSQIYGGTFANCTKLNTVTIKSAQVDDNAFEGCTALKTFNYTAPLTGQTIGSKAFLGCTPNVLIYTTPEYRQANPTAPIYAAYDTESTAIKTVADKGTSGKAFRPYVNNNTKDIAVSADDAKVYTVYVDGPKAIFQAMIQKNGKYTINPKQVVIFKTDEPTTINFETLATAGTATTAQDNVFVLSEDASVAAFQNDPTAAGIKYASVFTVASFSAGEYIYRLTNNAASDGFGFTLYSGTNLAAGQFFAITTKAPAAGRLQTVWLDEDGNVEGDATAIETVKTVVNDGVIYNLAGQKVDANYKGVVIKNGKKMIQK